MSLVRSTFSVCAISIALVSFFTAGAAEAQSPSFSCGMVQTGSIEEMICNNQRLSELDHVLSTVYTEAAQKAVNEQPQLLRAEQRGWIKGRNDCWKNADTLRYIEDSYRVRTAELQARYRLVSASGPFTFACDDSPGSELIATFYLTEPPTLIAERGDSVSLMYLLPSASGSKYGGRNETFWEHHGVATVTWGYGATEIHCRKNAISGSHK